LSRHDFTDVSIMDALHYFKIMGLMASLSSSHHGQPFFRGQPGRSDDRADPSRINRYWLFHKDMLARVDRRFEMSLPENGGAARITRSTSAFNTFSYASNR